MEFRRCRRGGRDVSIGAIDPIMIGKLRAALEGAYPSWRSDLPFIIWCLERYPGFVRIQINRELRQARILRPKVL